MATKKAETHPGGGTDTMLVGPYACLLAIDADSADWPDMSELAEGGLVLLTPDRQAPPPVGISRLAMPPHSHPKRALDRLDHLLRKMGVELPDVLTIALDDPAQSIGDALTAEGLGGLDLDAVAVLAVPTWVLPAADRAQARKICRYP